MRRLAFTMAFMALTICCCTVPALAAESVLISEAGDQWENLTANDSGSAVLAYNDNSVEGTPGNSQQGWIGSMYQTPANPSPVRPDRPNITNAPSDLEALFESGAQLIWERNPVRNPKTGDIVKFSKFFDTGNTIIGSGGIIDGMTRIYVSVDNAFIAFLNGQYIGCSDRSLRKTDWSDLSRHPNLEAVIVNELGDMGDSIVYSTSHVRVYSFDIPADYFKRGGTNELIFYACNKRVDVSQGDFSWDGKDGNYNSNSAFLMYSMTVDSPDRPYLDIKKEWRDYTGVTLSSQDASGLTATFKVSDNQGNRADLSAAAFTGDLMPVSDGRNGLVQLVGNGGGRIIMDGIDRMKVEEITSAMGYLAFGGYNPQTGVWEFINTEQSLMIDKRWLLNGGSNDSPDNIASFKVEMRSPSTRSTFNLSDDKNLIKNGAEITDAAGGLFTIGGNGSLIIRYVKPGIEFVVTEIESNNGFAIDSPANAVQSTIIGQNNAIFFTNTKTITIQDNPVPSGSGSLTGSRTVNDFVAIPDAMPPLVEIPDISPPLAEIPDIEAPLTGRTDTGMLGALGLLLLTVAAILKIKKD